MFAQSVRAVVARSLAGRRGPVRPPPTKISGLPRRWASITLWPP